MIRRTYCSYARPCWKQAVIGYLPPRAPQPALELLETAPDRRSVLDNVMPEMSGLELAKEIKRTVSSIPVILFSSTGQPDEAGPFIDVLFIQRTRASGPAEPSGHAPAEIACAAIFPPAHMRSQPHKEARTRRNADSGFAQDVLLLEAANIFDQAALI